MSARNSFLVAAAVGLLCAGCASREPTPEITRAQTLIEQAEKSGARQYAADQLDRAKDNLRLANAAQDKGKEDEARARANEAAADAELAQSRSQSSSAQKAANAVERSNETLERETQRTQGLPPAQPIPTQPVP
jgi:methylphosphotriester-DNA--protein-cysteine methyltransferase